MHTITAKAKYTDEEIKKLEGYFVKIIMLILLLTMIVMPTKKMESLYFFLEKMLFLVIFVNKPINH